MRLILSDFGAQTSTTPKALGIHSSISDTPDFPEYNNNFIKHSNSNSNSNSHHNNSTSSRNHVVLRSITQASLAAP